MAAGGSASLPTSPFISKLAGLFSGKTGLPQTNTNTQGLKLPDASNVLAQAAAKMGLSKPITTSQPVSQQGATPTTAGTVSQSGQTITPGAQPMNITPGGNAGGQTIVGAGQVNRGGQQQTPQDGLQATNQNLLRRAFSAGLEDILTQDVQQEQQKFASPMVREFRTQNEDKIRQQLQASELARSRRGQSSDYQSNQLMGLAAGAQADKTMADVNAQIQQDVLNQQNQRFKDMQDVRDFNVGVENYQADARNKERMAEALRKQQRAGRWGKIGVDALFGDPMDEAQNQQSAQQYLDAETKIKSGQQLKAKINEMTQKQKAIDDKYTKSLGALKAQYQNETDPTKKLELQTQYETQQLEYEAERKALNDEFERYRDEELPLQQLEISKQNQIRANRFTNPTNLGVVTRTLAKGGQLSASEHIAIEREKSRLKREEKREENEMKKQNSLLLARVKKELEESAKNRERNEKLRFKLIESLIDTTK